jgi:hypothetical protein
MEHLPKGVTPDDGETAERVLYPDVGRTWVAYFYTLGLWEIWRRRHYLVLTNQRLLHGKGTGALKKRLSVPLSLIEDAAYTKVAWLSGVEISYKGGTGHMKDAMYSPEDAHAFVEALNEAAAAYRTAIQAEVERRAAQKPAASPAVEAAPPGWRCRLRSP